jgi:glucosamine--fructose-6-phosphate aminotransferase (isomerizing)
MCGIIGIVSSQNITHILVDSLKRLEYRGYDSAGIATLENGTIQRCRAEGKIKNLEKALEQKPLKGTLGIAHTRWATHGAPIERNAHPHATDKVAVVHNGIIENFAELRAELEGLGHVFSSDTDTEVIVHQVTHYLDQGKTPQEAVSLSLKKLHGAYAIALLFKGHEDFIICARQGSPLAIGIGVNEMYLGSDALALAPLTQKICYLEEGDWAVISAQEIKIYDKVNEPVQRPVQITRLSGAIIGKGDYRHFMQKEIYEQPGVLGDVLQSFLNARTGHINLPPVPAQLLNTQQLTIVACGTSYYAAMVAKYWFEKIARVPVEIDIASEFRYRKPPLRENGVSIFISQSGETADTLAAMNYAKDQGQLTVAIVNVPESSLARGCDVVLETHAGPEIGVASTKAFLAQLMVLACFVLAFSKARNSLSSEEELKLVRALLETPAAISEVLSLDNHIRQLCQQLLEAKDVLYLGRGTSYAIALEGALKLKELSYIHAEAYAAGELKHGPIALIDEKMPVIVIAPYDDLFEKTVSNMEEVIARGGRVILVSDQAGFEKFKGKVQGEIKLPMVHPFVAPLVYAIPMQLLSYHTAVLKGTDVDQPRNLAKSVTVE